MPSSNPATSAANPLCCPAAINHQFSTTDVTAFIGGQKQGRSRHFIRITQPLCRDPFAECLPDFIAGLAKHRCISWARAECINSDATRCQLAVPGAGIGSHRCLAGGIGSLARISNASRDRPHQHDAAAHPHEPYRVLHRQHHGTHIQIKDAIKVLLRGRFQARRF